LALLRVAVNTSTGIETRERRNWPFQIGRVAGISTSMEQSSGRFR
jgi:hypothetical protein